MDPVSLVDINRRSANKSRKLTSGLPTQEIHLKEPVLRVGKPGTESEVFATGRRDRGYTSTVSFDCHAPANACD